MGDSSFNLPPGFRFYPSDEELVVHFLHRKDALLPCHPDVIPDLDLYPHDPWDLDGAEPENEYDPSTFRPSALSGFQSKAIGEGNKWYYYSRRTQGSTRMTGSGYWHSIGVEEPIYSTSTHKLIGMKKFCAFYVGQPSQGVKTNWIMQEYRLPDSSASSSRSSSKKRNSKNEHSKWVICRVYEDNCDSDDGDGAAGLSCLDEVFLSLDDLDEISLPN